MLGDHQRAAALLTDGIAAHTHAAALHNNLAVVHERQGRFDDAFAVVGAIVELASRQLRRGRPEDISGLEPVIERMVAGIMEQGNR